MTSPLVAQLVGWNPAVERIATGFSFTEGPVWHPDGYLLFSDVPVDIRRKWTERDGIVDERLGSVRKCNGMTLDAQLNLIVCEHATSKVVRVKLAPDGRESTREVIASHYRDQELNSPNDVVVADDGAIYFTDPWYGRMPIPHGVARPRDLDFCGLFRIGHDGALTLLAEDFKMPNGLCFSPAGDQLYVNDSRRAHVRVFDVGPDGLLSNGSLFAEDIGRGIAEEGGPDGMKCDRDGNVWVTGPRGIWLFSPEGELLGIIDTPELAANLAWGGPSWDTLYMTCSTSVYRLHTFTEGARRSYMR